MANGKLLIRSLRFVPKNLYSRLVGLLASLPLPVFLRSFVLSRFAGHFGASIEEAELPLDRYPSVMGFFTRRLRPGIHSIDQGAHTVLSPADGAVIHAGPVHEGQLLQVKGRPYSVEALLANDEVASRFSAGSYATVYLSPKDYHRVHSPVDGKITGYIYVPGTLWPVNSAGLHHVDQLFCRNERLITLIDTESFGKVAVAMVGATAVGKMSFAYDDIITNRWSRSPRRCRYPEGRPICRGDELGVFHLGSTVVLLTERGQLSPAHPPFSPLRMGTPLLLGAAETQSS